jgi:hypothetical protein
MRRPNTQSFVAIFFISLTYSDIYLLIVGAESYFLDVVAVNDTHTLGRIPLDEWSASRRDLTWQKQLPQKTDIRAAGDIRTRIPNKRAAADLNLRRRGYWDRQCGYDRT